MTGKNMSEADNYLPQTNQEFEEYRYLLLHAFDDGVNKIKGGKRFGKRSVDLFSIIQHALDDQDLSTVNLTYNDGTIENSAGSDAIIPDATALVKGLMTAALFAKLDGIEAGATADQTDLEIVTAINTELGTTIWQTGGGSYPFYQDGNARIQAKAGSVTYVTNNSTLGTLTISSVQDVATVSIIIEPVENTSFDLVIDDQSNTTNNWNPVTEGINEHDLFIPEYRVMDIGPTSLGLSQITDDSLQAQPIVPTFTFGGGRITFKFNGNQTFGSKTRLLLQLNFG